MLKFANNDDFYLPIGTRVYVCMSNVYSIILCVNLRGRKNMYLKTFHAFIQTYLVREDETPITCLRLADMTRYLFIISTAPIRVIYISVLYEILTVCRWYVTQR